LKKSGKYQYLQIVENNKVKGKVKQRAIATIGLFAVLLPANQSTRVEIHKSITKGGFHAA
jgi:hypothetical protein